MRIRRRMRAAIALAMTVALLGFGTGLAGVALLLMPITLYAWYQKSQAEKQRSQAETAVKKEQAARTEAEEAVGRDFAGRDPAEEAVRLVSGHRRRLPRAVARTTVDVR